MLIRERTALPRALLRKLPNLKLISQTGKAGGHIDVAAASELGITIAEGAGDPTAPAELTWALVMAAARRIPQYAANLKEGLWQTATSDPARNGLGLGVALKGRTLGIWGYGKIGRMVAGYGKAFGMRALIWGRDAGREQAVRDGFRAAASKEAFFSESDVLSLHLRLNDATRAIVSGGDFARMKPGAIFVNTSRAELVEPGALLAALDVFENEPLPVDSPLLRMDQVIATPHLGYVEKDSYELYFGVAFRNVVDFANGTPKNVVNPQPAR